MGPVPPERPNFAGYVFKIQANLDPRHRDRVAFLRVCAGKFEREMEVLHPRTGKKIRLKRAHRVFGQDRETMDEAFPGDIIGLVNPGEFHLGDTICIGDPVIYEGLPQFSPEFFATLRCPDTSRRKQFERGLQQLLEEGAIQVFTDAGAARKEPILAAVGELQLDVVRFRLESEYNTSTEIQWLPYKVARWVDAGDADINDIRADLALATGQGSVRQPGGPVPLGMGSGLHEIRKPGRAVLGSAARHRQRCRGLRPGRITACDRLPLRDEPRTSGNCPTGGCRTRIITLSTCRPIRHTEHPSPHTTARGAFTQPRVACQRSDIASTHRKSTG